MESMFYIKLLTICTSIWRVSAALTLENQDACPESDLSNLPSKKLYLAKRISQYKEVLQDYRIDEKHLMTEFDHILRYAEEHNLNEYEYKISTCHKLLDCGERDKCQHFNFTLRMHNTRVLTTDMFLSWKNILSVDNIMIALDTILVTKDQCGRSIELVPHNIVTLEYTGEDVGDIFSPCVIDFVNNVEDDMTCIRSNLSNWFSINCQMLLKYYPRGYTTDLYAKGYSCFDFSAHPICAMSSRSSVVYTRVLNSNQTLLVWLYTEKYIPTTTSSWSSWSSNTDSYDVDDDENSTGMVVGLAVGIVAIVVIVVICGVACRKKSQTPKPIYGPPVAVQFTPQNNQLQYPGAQPNTLIVQNQYTPDPSQVPGYQVHAPVYQSVLNQSMPVGYQPNQNYPRPSDNSPSTTGTGSQQQQQQQQFSSIPAETEPSAPSVQPSDPPPSYESLNKSDF